MRLVFVRHGKTAGNLAGCYIGSTDEPLSSQGISQLRELKACGMYPAAQRVYVSPMRRTLETAHLLYPGIPLVEEVDLRECDFGAFEGKCFSQLSSHPAYQAWLESGGHTAFPEGEKPDLFRTRCRQALEACVKRAFEEEWTAVAFVIHGGSIMAILSAFAREKKDFYDWQVENGGGFLCTVLQPEWRERHILDVQGKLIPSGKDGAKA